MTPATSFAGKRVALFGLGGSGLATARALVAGGARVACWDDGPAGREAASLAGLDVVDLRAADWSRFDAFVLSPGVPLTHPAPHWTVDRARAAGVEVIGDIEVFCRERAKQAPDAPFVAITGTNGKSTTTALTAHLFAAFGADVHMGGNIGVPVLALEPPAADRVHVLELSSFQIDLTPSLHPSISVLLNVTPDHLDRHGTMETYAAIKERLVASADHAVIAIDDEFTRAIADRQADTRRHLTLVTTFATPITGSFLPVEDGEGDHAEHGGGAGKQHVPSGSHALATSPRSGEDHAIIADRTTLVRIVADGVREPLADLAGIGTLRGRHNAQNAAAAVAALLAADFDRDLDLLQRALASFQGLPHRMEEIAREDRVRFVNDSKATNADAAEKALSSFRDIFWIAGGRAKEGGIVPLAPLFPRIAKAYLIGEAAADFARTLGPAVPFDHCGTLDVAVAMAAADAARSSAPEPVVLLSPACASYDQFPNYEVRGERFRTLVRQTLASRTGAAA